MRQTLPGCQPARSGDFRSCQAPILPFPGSNHCPAGCQHEPPAADWRQHWQHRSGAARHVSGVQLPSGFRQAVPRAVCRGPFSEKVCAYWRQSWRSYPVRLGRHHLAAAPGVAALPLHRLAGSHVFERPVFGLECRAPLRAGEPRAGSAADQAAIHRGNDVEATAPSAPEPPGAPPAEGEGRSVPPPVRQPDRASAPATNAARTLMPLIAVAAAAWKCRVA